VSDDKICNELNEYFCNVGPNLFTVIRLSHSDYLISNIINNHNFRSMYFEPITELEVAKLSLSLEVSKYMERKL